MSAAGVVGTRKRRRLSPSEKYEIYVSVLTGQATQREAAHLVDEPVVGLAVPPDDAVWRAASDPVSDRRLEALAV
jgi:hypothetical protein